VKLIVKRAQQTLHEKARLKATPKKKENKKGRRQQHQTQQQ